MAKKKPQKHDITVGLNTDFANAMRIALSQIKQKPMTHQEHLNILSLTKGEFILNSDKPIWPLDNGKLSSKSFNAVQLTGFANAPFTIHFDIGLAQSEGQEIDPDDEGNINLPFPITPNTLFFFSCDKLNEGQFCKINFDLIVV